MAYTNFAGWLIGTTANTADITANNGIVTYNNVTIQTFPHKYIKEGSYSITPDQREQLEVWRDDYTRDLYMITAAGRKTVFNFTTRDNLHLKQVDEIQNFFLQHESNSTERKIYLYFWNMETMAYDSGYFYRPNMPFSPKAITSNDMRFGELNFDFVEY